MTEEIAMPTAVEDKDAIREVLAEYCFRLDDGRFAEMAALFAEDGTWDTAFGKATGRSAIAELASSLRTRGEQPRPRAVHLVTQHRDHARRRARSGALELDGDAKQPAGAAHRLGRGLYRRASQNRRTVAVPLPQDRSLHRRLTTSRLLGPSAG
jgi:hypothetical protein